MFNVPGRLYRDSYASAFLTIASWCAQGPRMPFLAELSLIIVRHLAVNNAFNTSVKLDISNPCHLPRNPGTPQNDHLDSSAEETLRLVAGLFCHAMCHGESVHPVSSNSPEYLRSQHETYQTFFMC